MIRTERLILRPGKPEDIPAVVRVMNDPRVAQWSFRASRPFTEQDACLLVEWITMDFEPATYIIADPTSDQVMGIVRLDADGPAGELSYCLAPEHEGQGYASEAVLALLRSRAQVCTVYASVHPANHHSRRLLSRVGFEYVGGQVRNTGSGKGNVELLFYQLKLPLMEVRS